ncbi:pyridoxamine 5'-phosphate oxidase family protein [Pseudomonas sp. CCM 7891]|uniref:Pyridoxamine 5'-phosphate oxidase family protein n=1 Tax=Pseudomonas karstica TaxID=1055468 RepID=A0A7X2RN36_9PSED|nr:pyridoxamine 5'-phosphate oxidase family protein [Pseudomonas karstica]MTD17869.1 pyridoxamine 5'-phosphate oxidase family protein [Pseudomonas karstica]
MKLSLAERCDRLLHTTRFITLATASAHGAPWASTVNYVYRTETESLLWYSMSDSLHSRNIEQEPNISGSIFRTDLGDSAPPVGLDGIQLSGFARAIPDNEIEIVHKDYYRINFPDKDTREQWMLPLSDFNKSAKRSFYELRIRQLWLLDLERWSYDKNDQRIEVLLPLSKTN